MNPEGRTPTAARPGWGLAAARPTGGLVLAAEAAWPMAHRLVVLVPATLANETALATRLYAAASPRRLNVLYLGLVTHVEDEPGLRRRLALLAACTRDNHAVQADYRLAVGEDWLAWLSSAWTPGDLVICHSEQRLGWGRRARPLGDMLAETLGLTVVVLTGFCTPEADPAVGALRNVLFWSGTMLTVAAFYGLQAGIQQRVAGTAQSLLLMLSVIVEFALLAGWSKRLA